MGREGYRPWETEPEERGQCKRQHSGGIKEREESQREKRNQNEGVMVLGWGGMGGRLG